MNNICTKCGKLNTLDRKVCHYCGGECQKMANAQLSNFMIKLNQRKESPFAKVTEDGKEKDYAGD